MSRNQSDTPCPCVHAHNFNCVPATSGIVQPAIHLKIAEIERRGKARHFAYVESTLSQYRESRESQLIWKAHATNLPIINSASIEFRIRDSNVCLPDREFSRTFFMGAIVIFQW